MQTSDIKKISALFVISQDSGAGAPRAVHRIYTAVRTFFSSRVDVTMRVIHKTYDDDHIVGGKATRSRLEYIEYFVRTRFRKYFPRKPFISDNKLLHSQALYHSGLGREINSMNPDVVMLGWLGNSTLSIPEIGRISAPVVWRLSDMWMFSGAEHYTANSRYVDGYSRKSRPTSESGPDIDRETFLRKKRHWKKPCHVITPSKWMAEQVKSSTLTAKWPVHVIPNPIDTDYWQPRPVQEARDSFSIPENALLILFGTGGGTQHHHKGGDLLLDALPVVNQLLSGSGNDRPVYCAIFGEERESFKVGTINVIFLGRLNDQQLINAYSAADVMVVPSRLDNLPSTAVESQSCGTPVVAFEVGGLPDIVEHQVTGLIVPPFDIEQLAHAISHILLNPKARAAMSAKSRSRAREIWNPEVIANQYVEVLLLAASEGELNERSTASLTS